MKKIEIILQLDYIKMNVVNPNFISLTNILYNFILTTILNRISHGWNSNLLSLSIIIKIRNNVFL